MREVKMKRFLLLLFLFSGMFLSAKPIEEIDLKSYVAKYSKNGDDTEAFKKAFADMQKRNLRFLRIPPGFYNVSDTINISGWEIRGDGYPVISMKNPNKDIFTSKGVWKIRISGISFQGGKSQIAIGNNNTDRGHFQIENCLFQNASDFAVKIFKKTNSTHVIIDKCTFYNNMQALHAVSDLTKIANCWLTTSPKMVDKAVIVNYGCLTAEHILGVPLPPAGKRAVTKPRWIDNYGSVTCRDFRFGGEGAGFTPVYNYAMFDSTYPIIPNKVILDNCQVYCAGQEVIRFYEIPNRVKINDCVGMVDTKMFTFEPTINWTPVQKRPNLTNVIKIVVENSGATFKTKAPSYLKPVIRYDLIEYIPGKGQPVKKGNKK